MPTGHSLSVYARFSRKKRTLMYISWEQGDHCYIKTRYNDLFSHNNLFLENLKKNWPEKRASILFLYIFLFLIYLFILTTTTTTN